MARVLLDGGADPRARLGTGESVLMTAARTGNVEIVRLLLAAGADPNVAEAYRGQTALMWAVAERHYEVVRTLLEAHADVHARTRAERDAGGPKTRGGSTALIFAARDGDVRLAELLVSHGARINDVPADDERQVAARTNQPFHGLLVLGGRVTQGVARIREMIGNRIGAVARHHGLAQQLTDARSLGGQHRRLVDDADALEVPQRVGADRTPADRHRAALEVDQPTVVLRRARVPAVPIEGDE